MTLSFGLNSNPSQGVENRDRPRLQPPSDAQRHDMAPLRCRQLTAEASDSIPPLEQLRALGMAGCFRVPVRSLFSLCARCRALQTTNLSGCDESAGAHDERAEGGAAWLTSRLRLRGGREQLASLRVLAFHALSEARTLSVLPRTFTELQALLLRQSPLMSDESVLYVLRNCPSLRLLDVSGCEHVRGHFLAFGASASLSSLLMRDCVQLGEPELPGRKSAVLAQVSAMRLRKGL